MVPSGARVDTTEPSVAAAVKSDGDMKVIFSDRREPICATVNPSGNVTLTNVCAGGVDSESMMFPAESPGFSE